MGRNGRARGGSAPISLVSGIEPGRLVGWPALRQSEPTQGKGRLVVGEVGAVFPIVKHFGVDHQALVA